MNPFEKVRDAIATTLRVPVATITATTKDKDIASWDSLGHINLMVMLEQTFDIYLDVEDFPNLTSVPTILEYLKQHGIH